ncbi:MAG TPA: hypothetical protein VM576_03045 [Xanthomonadaceae bacterium]|nr:hypothetical protein [Xanthomonadaceae bacterium]
MSWIGLAVVLLALYLAFKVAGVLLRLLLWAVVLIGGYWLLAPLLGLPGWS